MNLLYCVLFKNRTIQNLCCFLQLDTKKICRTKRRYHKFNWIFQLNDAQALHHIGIQKQHFKHTDSTEWKVFVWSDNREKEYRKKSKDNQRRIFSKGDWLVLNHPRKQKSNAYCFICCPIIMFSFQMSFLSTKNR